MDNYFKHKLKIIDSIINEFLKDMLSFRVQLVYMSYIFNLIVLYAVVFRNLDWKALSVSFGTQTILYMFYFASKSKQAEMEARQITKEDDIRVERNPEE